MDIALLIFTIVSALGTAITAIIAIRGFRDTKKEIAKITGNLDLKNEIRGKAGLPPLQK